MTIRIGADVSKTKVHCAFERAPGKWQFKVFANQSGTAKELLAYVREKVGGADETCSLQVVMEGDSAPHFTTIASFDARLPADITSVFREVLLVCDEQGLIGKELFAVDGCKLPSNASRRLAYWGVP